MAPAVSRRRLPALMGAVVSAVLALLALPPSSSGAQWWTDSFSSGTLSNWSYWGQGQEADYGRPRVVTSGRRFVALRKRPGDRALHHKLYKSFNADNWPSGRDTGRSTSSPMTVSGRYSCRMRVPRRGLRLGRNGWINMMQFKEDYETRGGTFQSVPGHWFGLSRVGGRLAFGMAAYGGRHPTRTFAARPLLGRWLTIEMRLRQGRRLQLFVDGRRRDVARDRDFPVGRRYFVGRRDEQGRRVTANRGWTFGVGNYAGTVGQSGLVQVDDCRVRPL